MLISEKKIGGIKCGSLGPGASSVISSRHGTSFWRGTEPDEDLMKRTCRPHPPPLALPVSFLFQWSDSGSQSVCACSGGGSGGVVIAAGAGAGRQCPE